MLNYPKVLVIDHMPFNRISNNGIVKSNLFQDWPKEKLANIFTSSVQPGFDVCNQYWCLRKSDILLGLVGRAPSGKMVIPKDVQEDGLLSECACGFENRALIERKLSILPTQLRTLMGEFIFLLPSVFSSPLRLWIEEFQPDIIFSMLSSIRMLRTVVKSSQLWDIPILPYFTDDWVTTLYKDHLLSPLLRRVMFYLFNECLQRAPVGMTICDAMAEEYMKRYGGNFKTSMNIVDCSTAGQLKQKSSSGKIVRFVFIGSLAPGRWRSIRSVGEALLNLYSEGVNSELLIYTFPKDVEKYRTCLTLEPVMRIVGTASYDQVANIQREADVLVHVESFEKAIREYTRFSLSTKIPQYMMAGQCIFAYGPGEVASIRYLSDTRSGITVGEDNPTLLRAVLRKLVKSSELRQITAARAQKFAFERNEGTKQREKFRQVVLQACKAWSKHN